jgi:hypothetical protein
MRTKRRTLAAAAVLLACIAVGGFFLWKRGTPYQQPYWSPNREYYIQKYSNLMPSQLTPGMPGHGSDAIGGYIRLYNKSGRLLHERLQTFSRDVEPVWAGDKVYLKGVAEMDGAPWVLPSSAE